MEKTEIFSFTHSAVSAKLIAVTETSRVKNRPQPPRGSDNTHRQPPSVEDGLSFCGVFAIRFQWTLSPDYKRRRFFARVSISGQPTDRHHATMEE
ncbi:MAG TPA: hypothetical protein VMY42_14865 [Thermoguttaceae bacterium]|nr:hypothetical protein [Thermoguttaceae bacterium]